MGCFAFQTFWTPVAIYALPRGLADLAGWFFSAATYSGAAVLLGLRGSRLKSDRSQPDEGVLFPSRRRRPAENPAAD